MTEEQFPGWCDCSSSDPDLVARRFYIALCLLISAASDYAIGLELKDTRKLNWSCTCSYYSMVHSGRLIAYLALGGYPHSHKHLIRIFDSSSGSDITLNCPLVTDTANGRTQRLSADAIDMRLLSYYRHDSDGSVTSELDRLGQVLVTAQKIREDGNYESLIIAHEYNHTYVTELFESLSEEMSKCASSALALVVKCFMSYHHWELTRLDNGDGYCHFVAKYVQKRILDQVAYRCQQKYSHICMSFSHPCWY